MILVLDTSTTELLVAIATDEGQVLRESRRTAGDGERGIHDARLASEVAALLRDIGATPRDITRIGLVIGPGSFTGLRIGLSFAKGLAYSLGAQLVTITQHEALFHEMGSEADVSVAPGYRPGLYYLASKTTPSTIKLVSDLSSLTGRRVVAHTSLLAAGLVELRHASFAEITSGALASISAQSTSAVAGAAIDALEPVYVTDFTPGRQ